MVAYLICEDGPHAGSVINLEDGEEWVLGRDPEMSQHVLEDPMVSRKHVLIRLEDGQYFIENLSGVNPAQVNNHPLEEVRELKEDDSILIGNNFFRFSEKPPEEEIEEAKEEHHENPPYGDRMILTDKTHKGHLRGRSAFIGNHIYVVIYGDESGELSQKQITLLRKSHLNLLNEIRFRISKEKINLMDSAHFINESGEIIEL